VRSPLTNPSTYSAKIFQLFVLIISITAIELIIRWNNITGTYNIKSTGQVIPLIIGSAGLWKVVFQIILSRSEGKEVRNLGIKVNSRKLKYFLGGSKACDFDRFSDRSDCANTRDSRSQRYWEPRAS